ncbi:MAG: hypothetical protein GY867_03385 [bacterium]|nr:hypothetical protein [bacterium]
MQTFVDLNLTQLLVLLAGYLVTFLFSGLVVRAVLGPFPVGENQEPPESPKPKKPADLGVIIGKCENFLTVTLILADQVTGLAVIFAAKSILRAEDMKNNPRYYLGGTMVNLCFSVLVGVVTRWALGHFG